MRFTCRVHGLSVESDLEIGPPATVEGTPDVRIVLGAPVVGEEPPVADGEVLADLAHPEGRVFYAFFRLNDGSYFLRWHGLMDVELDAGAQLAVVHPYAEVDLGLVEVLTKGALLAFVLTVRGTGILHASCVDYEGSAVAFVGASGMGKSTLATLVCQSGATMVTDDVLRVDPSPAGVLAFKGVAETRLRPAAQYLAEQFADGERSETADGRNAIRLPLSPQEELPLRLIAIPSPDRESKLMTVERLDQMKALLLLSQFPRFPGWRGGVGLSLQFEKLAAVIALVPVVILRVPWGPPFEPVDLKQVLANI